MAGGCIAGGFGIGGFDGTGTGKIGGAGATYDPGCGGVKGSFGAVGTGRLDPGKLGAGKLDGRPGSARFGACRPDAG